MEASVSVRNLGKCFKLYRRSEYRLLEALLPGLKLHRQLWALRHVSFELSAGQSLAVIGPNGAGKSTLLRILAGACAPTEGSYVLRGRVGAVLELGLGFAPTLTGRQNIRLAALMMGLTAEETDEQIDAIAAFSELGEYLDRPVREYSSGMRSRLGFSIASHLDVQVLLADEALSAGDHVFRLRAAQRVRALLDRGVTLIYATHSARRARELCQRAIWIEYGRVMEEGPVEQVIRAYSMRGRSVVLSGPRRQERAGAATILAVRLQAGQGQEPLEIEPLEPITCVVDLYCSRPTTAVELAINCVDQSEKPGRSVLLSRQFPGGLELSQGFHRLTVTFRAPRLPGVYDVMCRLGTARPLYGDRFYESRVLPESLLVREPQEETELQSAGVTWAEEPLDAARLAGTVPSRLDFTDPETRTWLRSGWCCSRGRFGPVGPAEFFIYLPVGTSWLELHVDRVPNGISFRIEFPAGGQTVRCRCAGDGIFRAAVPESWTGRAVLLVLVPVDEAGEVRRLAPGREPLVLRIEAVSRRSGRASPQAA